MPASGTWVDAERQKELAAIDEFIRHPPPPVTKPDGSVTFQGPSLANLKARQVSVTKLIEEMATVLMPILTETRFELRAARGRGQLARGKGLLDQRAYPWSRVSQHDFESVTNGAFGAV
jgi:hypothetical protein